MLKALDMAAEMSGWGTPLPKGTARAIALEERGAEGNGSATISAMVHTVSVSRDGKVRLERVDVAHDTGFGLVNPLSVKKQIEGRSPGSTTTPCTRRRRLPTATWWRTTSTVPAVAHRRGPARDQHPLLPDAALADRHGARPRHVGAVGIGDAIFQITGKRFRDLPYSKHDLTWS
jgi:isoquinoline 1-oxidoreductase beta subunit